MNILISRIPGMPPEFGAHLGFVKAPLAAAVDELHRWRTELGFEPNRLDLRGGLAENASSLLPIAPLPEKRELLVATRDGDWTAYFTSGFRGGDPRGPLSVIGTRLDVATLMVAAIPFRGGSESVETMLGSFIFEYVSAGSPRISRSIALVEGESSSSRYHFELSGPEQPWEDTARYKARLKRDRVTPELLEKYSQALGIDVFNLDFYSGPCVYIERTRFESSR